MKRAKQINGIAAVICLVLVSAVASPAQSVEETLAALEARIQQLESELAAAKQAGLPAGLEANRSVVETSGGMVQNALPYVRPAVLVTSTSSPEPAAALAPLQQGAGSGDFSGDFEGFNFFKGVKFGGFLDAYYGFNFDEPADRKILYRNFDFNHNSLTLSQVDFEVSKAVNESNPLGYMLQMAFGPTAEWVNFPDLARLELEREPRRNRLTDARLVSDNSTAAHFMQYYLSGRVPVGRGLTLEIGKFVTQHGAEVIDTRADWNYSRGLLFAWAIPYYHFGVRATYPVSDKLTVAGFLVNGWNNVLENNGGKTYSFQLVWNPSSRFSFVQNYMVGPEQADVSDSENTRHLWDSLITIKLHDKVTFMTNFDYGMDRIVGGEHVHWIGTANYLKFQLSDSFALTPRFEFYSDPMGFTTGARQQLKEFTITPEFVISNNLVTRFEYRHDWSNEDVFGGDDPSSQDTAAVGLILKF